MAKNLTLRSTCTPTGIVIPTVLCLLFALPSHPACAQDAGLGGESRSGTLMLEAFGPAGTYALYYEGNMGYRVLGRCGLSVEYYKSQIEMIALPVAIHIPVLPVAKANVGLALCVTPAWVRIFDKPGEPSATDVYASFAIGPEVRINRIFGGDFLRIAFCGGYSLYYSRHSNNGGILPPLWLSIGYGVTL